jgi:hypothetical protein
MKIQQISQRGESGVREAPGLETGMLLIYQLTSIPACSQFDFLPVRRL